MGWKIWIGKVVFIRTKHGKVFSGKVIDVDATSLPLVWIVITDKFNERVQLSVSEIVEIKEESR